MYDLSLFQIKLFFANGVGLICLRVNALEEGHKGEI